MPVEEETLRSAVYGAVDRIAHGIKDRMDKGMVTELRRLDERRPKGAAFYRCLVDYIEPSFRLPKEQETLVDVENLWGSILRGMSIVTHARGRRAGRVFAESGVSETRLFALLRASSSSLPPLLRRALQIVAESGSSIDWQELGLFVLTSRFGNGDISRVQIARDYLRFTEGTRSQEEES